MHGVLLRIKRVKTNQIFEVCVDDRMSFKENLKMLASIIRCDANKSFVYDPTKRIFLTQDVPIREFFISNFMMLYIFE